MGVALGHVVDICLPFPSLDRRAADVPSVCRLIPEEGTIPVRQMGKHREGEWRFAPWAAVRVAGRVFAALACSIVPAPFGRLPLEHARAAVEYLAHAVVERATRTYAPPLPAGRQRGHRAWAARLYRGHRGEPLPVPRNWRAVDFSRSGPADRCQQRSDPSLARYRRAPRHSFRGWRGLATRHRSPLRMWATHAGLGIELLARLPSLGVVDDGRSSDRRHRCAMCRAREKPCAFSMPANAPAAWLSRFS